jgi:hypothetical protein
MDILRFVKWWWNQRNSSERLITFFLSSFVVLFIGIYFFGLKALLLYLAGIVTCLIGFLLNQLRIAIMEQWDKFQVEREREAQQIIARLGGRAVPIENDPIRESLIDKISARSRKGPKPV